jgi:DNA-directed RNA polymerase specialized sigma24 family protein
MNHLKQLINEEYHGQVEEMIHGLAWRFTTWIYRCILNGLQEHVRREARLKSRTVDADLHGKAIRVHRDHLRCPGMVELLREAGEDAAVVLRVLVELPADLVGCRPSRRRRKLKTLLRRMHGWSVFRVGQAFKVLEEAISQREEEDRCHARAII